MTWIGWGLLVLGAAVVANRMWAYHSSGLDPLELWNVCSPREVDQPVLDCVDPATIPTFWPPVIAAGVVAGTGAALLLALALSRLQAHAKDVSRASVSCDPGAQRSADGGSRP